VTFLNLNMPHPALISGTRNGLALEGADSRLLKIPIRNFAATHTFKIIPTKMWLTDLRLLSE